MSHPVCYTRRMKNMTNKEHNDNVFLKEEARLLLNNEVKVTSTRSQFFARRGRVNKVMADGRTLEVTLFSQRTASGQQTVFLDVSLFSEVNDPCIPAAREQSLGPDANSVLPHNRL